MTTSHRDTPQNVDAFADLARRRAPLDLDPEPFATAGHRLVDDVAALLASIQSRPVAASRTPMEVRGALDAGRSLPEEGADIGALLASSDEMLAARSTWNGHPRFFGYITGAPAPAGILADFLASAVNPNMGAWGLSPMGSEIEAQAVRWVAELVGFPAGGDGIFVSGGNVANMLGFWAGRAAKAKWDVRASGTRAAEGGVLRAYAPRGTHIWIEKAADLSALGTEAVRWIETGPDGRVDLEALEAAIETDAAAGDRPLLVAGTAGSVSTGVVDPLPALREIRDRHGLWFHVDGAYGAFAAAASNAPPVRWRRAQLLRARDSEHTRVPGPEGVDATPAGVWRGVPAHDRRRHRAGASVSPDRGPVRRARGHDPGAQHHDVPVRARRPEGSRVRAARARRSERGQPPHAGRHGTERAGIRLARGARRGACAPDVHRELPHVARGRAGVRGHHRGVRSSRRCWAAVADSRSLRMVDV